MNFKTTLILLIVIGGLFAGVYLLPDSGDPEGDPTTPEPILEGFVESAITKVEILRSTTDPVVLTRHRDAWALAVGDATVRADASRVRDLLGAVDGLRPLRTIGEASAEKRREYGLDSQRRVVLNLYREDGTVFELHFGRTAAKGTGTLYACAGEDAPVVVIPDGIRAHASRGTRDFRDPAPVAVQAYDVETLEIHRTEGDGLRARFDADEQVWRVWSLGDGEPRALGFGDAKTIDALRLAAADLVVDGPEGFVSDTPTPEDLETYGLATPAHRVALTVRESAAPRTLRVGRRDADAGTFFWMIEGEPSVYRSRTLSDPGEPPALCEVLDKPRSEFRDRALLRLPAYKGAERLTLRVGDDRIRIEKKPNRRQSLHWRILEPAVHGWAQDEVVDDFVHELKQLEVEAFADDLSVADAGMASENPEYAFEIGMAGDESPRRFVLGRETEDGKRYLGREGSEQIVLAPKKLVWLLEWPWYRFRNRDVTMIEPSLVTRIEVVRGDTREILEAEGDTWKTVEPTIGEVDPQAPPMLLAAFFPLEAAPVSEDGARGFVAQETADRPLDLAAWGLEPEAARVTLTYRTEAKSRETKTLTLIIGTLVDGRHFARTRGAGELRDSLVFDLSDQAWEALSRPMTTTD